jgi:hypothetical protein
MQGLWKSKYTHYLSLNPNDSFPIKGKIGDCWLLSAIAAVASKPELIEKICVHVRIRTFASGSVTVDTDG